MMRSFLTVLIFLTTLHGYGQRLSGQWSGGFNSGDMFGGQNEYVLELEVKGETVAGYSYTYFNLINKRCYVICRLSGSYDKASKSITVKEVEKVKSNTPPDFKDCLQIHYLTYMKAEGKEVLVGKWKPANPADNCGTGQTELERKQLVKVVPQNSTPPVASKNNPSKPNTPATTTPKTGATKSTPPVAKSGTTPKTNTTPKTTTTPPKTSTATTKPPATTTKPKTPAVASNNTNKTQTIDKDLPKIEKPKAPSTIISPGISRIDKRSKQIVKTIEVDSKTFRVDLYDNGQIDGDTISLYLNGKLMVSRQRLSTEPVSLNVTMSEDDNELIMYAENLGSIPPNTALMVVTVGDKRYEVNISSSEQTNGAVRFHYRSKN